MKFRIFPLFILFVVSLLVAGFALSAHADPLQWQVPYFGTVNLNLTTSEALLGYDGILKQAITGISLPVYTDPKGIITLQAGAVAPWPTNAATVEPYLAAGHDILKEIPFLSQYSDCHLNIFGRYATAQGKAGAGISFSYAFAGGTSSPAPAPAPTAAPVP